MKLATTRARPRPAPAFRVRQNIAQNFNICNVPGSRLAGAVGRRVKLRTLGRRQLKGEVVFADESRVRVDETEIPYDEIVRANLIDGEV